jgi:hypothetical protein
MTMVRVRDDATVGGFPGAPPSACRGWIGKATNGKPWRDEYEVLVNFGVLGTYSFRWDELELLK